MSYSVVIPSNSADRLRKCVKSILGTHPDMLAHKIIVIDDGAKAGWTSRDAMVRWADGPKPFIFSRNVNIGINLANEDDVIICGDDVRVISKGGFDFLEKASHTSENPIISAAVEGVVGNIHQAPRRTGPRLIRDNPTRELAFVCVYIPRLTLDIVGALDERFDQYGCEDVDYSWRVLNAGGRLLIDDRCVVAHNDPDMPSAFRNQPDVNEKGQRAIAILKEKWAKHPGRPK